MLIRPDHGRERSYNELKRHPTETHSCAVGRKGGEEKGKINDKGCTRFFSSASLPHAPRTFQPHPNGPRSLCLLGVWLGLVAFSQAASLPGLSLPLYSWMTPTLDLRLSPHGLLLQEAFPGQLPRVRRRLDLWVGSWRGRSLHSAWGGLLQGAMP